MAVSSAIEPKVEGKSIVERLPPHEVTVPRESADDCRENLEGVVDATRADQKLADRQENFRLKSSDNSARNERSLGE